MFSPASNKKLSFYSFPHFWYVSVINSSPYDSTGAIVKKLASKVNLSYYMDLWTLGSKLQKNNCWTFFQ